MRSTFIMLLILTAVSSHAGDAPLIFSRQHGVPLIDVKVNGKVARFILDTGATKTLVSADLTTGSVRERSEFRGDQNGLEVYARWWEIDFEVAGRRWPRRTVGIVDLSRVREHYGKDISGLLGQDVLKEFDTLRIDYRRKVLTLE